MQTHVLLVESLRLYPEHYNCQIIWWQTSISENHFANVISSITFDQETIEILKNTAGGGVQVYTK